MYQNVFVIFNIAALVTRQDNLLSERFEWLQPFLNIDIKQAFYIVVEQIIKNDKFTHFCS